MRKCRHDFLCQHEYVPHRTSRPQGIAPVNETIKSRNALHQWDFFIEDMKLTDIHIYTYFQILCLQEIHTHIRITSPILSNHDDININEALSSIYTLIFRVDIIFTRNSHFESVH